MRLDRRLNVVSTFILALMLIHFTRQMAQEVQQKPDVSILVSSVLHLLVDLLLLVIPCWTLSGVKFIEANIMIHGEFNWNHNFLGWAQIMLLSVKKMLPRRHRKIWRRNSNQLKNLFRIGYHLPKCQNTCLVYIFLNQKSSYCNERFLLGCDQFVSVFSF